MIKVILDRPRQQEERAIIIQIAMQVWRDYFGIARSSPAAPRIDCGVGKPRAQEELTAGDQPEKAAFVRRRRAEAASIAWDNSGVAGKEQIEAIMALEKPPGWTENHTKGERLPGWQTPAQALRGGLLRPHST